MQPTHFLPAPTRDRSPHRRPTSTPTQPRVLAGVVAACGLAVAACTPADGDTIDDLILSEIRTSALPADWAQLGRTPRHTSYNPFETTIGPDTVGALQPQWTCCDTGRFMDVAVWRGRVFVTNPDPSLEFPTTEPFSLLSAFDAATGDEVWAAPTGQDGTISGVMTAPAVGYGRLFAQDENTFFGVSTVTGDFVDAPSRLPGLDVASSSPVAARRAVYVDTTDRDDGPGIRSLRAFSETGTSLWTQGLDGRHREPAVANDRIWTVVGERRLQAFAIADGQPLWATEPTDSMLGSPSITGGRVFAVSYPHTVHAFDETTGAALWTATHTGGVSSSNPPPADPPAVDDRNVYVAVDKAAGGIAVGAFDVATGARRFSVIVGTSRRSGLLAVANGVIYVPSEDGHLYAIDRSDGRTLADLVVGGPVRSPAVSDGRLVVPTSGAGVTVFGLRD